MPTTNRFDNSLGEEYDLFQKAVPHHDQLQEMIGQIIQRYIQTNAIQNPIIFEGGVGTGITTKILLSVDHDATIVGVDNEPKTLQFAEHSLALYQDRLLLCQDDLLANLQQQPDSTFDAFVSVWVIHNLTPDYRKKLFSEIKRTLKPGGLFINGDKYAQDNLKSHAEDLQQQLSLFDIFEEIGRPDLKTEWTKHYLEDEKVKIIESAQKSILRNLGFKDIAIPYRQGMEAIFTAIA